MFPYGCQRRARGDVRLQCQVSTGDLGVQNGPQRTAGGIMAASKEMRGCILHPLSLVFVWGRRGAMAVSKEAQWMRIPEQSMYHIT